MYKVATDMLPELEKRIRAIGRKLDKYNLMWEFKKSDPILEKVNVYDIDPMNGARCRVGERIVQVTPYTFWMEQLKLQGLTVVARIEHDALTVDGETRNMVHAVNDHPVQGDWWYIASKCEHCGTNRRRNVTIMMQNTDGEYYQIGSSCVKEFVGIDANDVISLYATINDIYLDEAYIEGRSGNLPPREYIETEVFLACILENIELHGYQKTVTAYDSFAVAKDGKFDERFISRSRELIMFFETLDIDVLPSWEQSFYRDVVRAVTQQYTRCNGLIAYAPVAYDKVITILAEVERKSAEPVSAWQGEIGQKIQVQVTLERSIGYDNTWGYSYIHLFRDAEGNIYKWSTGSSLTDRKVDGILTGTIKAHDEYDGQKQTAVTRCKIS